MNDEVRSKMNIQQITYDANAFSAVKSRRVTSILGWNVVG